jgi:hypothetical protein
MEERLTVCDTLPCFRNRTVPVTWYRPITELRGLTFFRSAARGLHVPTELTREPTKREARKRRANERPRVGCCEELGAGAAQTIPIVAWTCWVVPRFVNFPHFNIALYPDTRRATAKRAAALAKMWEALATHQLGDFT